jgi:hypothetical protein
MLQVKFGKKDDPISSFKRTEDLIAVRTVSTRSVKFGAVPDIAAQGLADTKLVLAFPEAGVEVYKIDENNSRQTFEERKTLLKSSTDVKFAGGVVIDEASGEPIVYTENIFIKFFDNADPDQCARVIEAAGLIIKRKLEYAANAFFVEAPSGTGTKVFEISLKLLERDDVEYCHPEIVRKRGFKAIFEQQWHLVSTVINGIAVNASANVAAAHAITEGSGTIIAVIDDGVDIDHIEFQTPDKIVAPRDVTLRVDNPRPKDPYPLYPEIHGTACAGVACADGFKGACGVAPKARLMPIRLASELGSQNEADAFYWAVNHGADVISCSWGPADGAWFKPEDPRHHAVVPLPASTKLAIDYAVNQGRKGKGCAVIFAAGNGNESVDNDGYASYENVIAVAACNDTSKRSVYSDFGDALWCAFPSGDAEFIPAGHPAPLTTGIWTTDRTGYHGYNPGVYTHGDVSGNYTNSFGGTSSACPGVAGVVALMLAVNPSLSVLEIKDILKNSCDKIDDIDGKYNENGKSKLYGFGRVNAGVAVRLAKEKI